MKDITDKVIILFGCGAVGKSILYHLSNFFIININKLIIVDIIDYRTHPIVKPLLEKGATYCVCNINKIYKRMIKDMNEWDIIIDASCKTNSIGIIEECKKHNIHYINTSIESSRDLDENRNNDDDDLYNQSYLSSHNDVLKINKLYPDKRASAMVVFGFNPGFITICIKNGLMHMAKQHIPRSDELDLYIKNKSWNKICKYLGIQIIHCSESDNAELFDKTLHGDRFINTWCVHAFLQEYNEFCEFGYGSAQKRIPKNAEFLTEKIINLKATAKTTYCESYVPNDGVIIGTVIPHSENISGPSYFGDMNYGVTMHYVYKFSPLGFRSIKNYENKCEDKTKKAHVVNNLDDKFYGVDKVGALILSNDKALWCGSILDNKETKWSNGTVQQVSASVLSCLNYLLENPYLGILFPEAIDDYEYILNLSRPYLGEVFCDFVDYKPKSLQFEDMLRTKEQFDAQYSV
jgi:homospermidine synthase